MEAQAGVGSLDPILAVRGGQIAPDLEFTVVGLPAPQGSKTRMKFAMVESSKAVKPWREAVVARAHDVLGFDYETGLYPAESLCPLEGPLIASMVFTMPMSQEKARKAKKSRVFADQNGRNDVSKLCRSTEDALVTAGVIQDDGRIVEYLRLGKTLPGQDEEAFSGLVTGVRIKLWSIVRVIEEFGGQPVG